MIVTTLTISRRIELVVSCWRYSRCLAYQLQSLTQPCQDGAVQITVCMTEEDKQTRAVVDYWSPLLAMWEHVVSVLVLPLPELLRREIGRNRRALDTKADLIWFLDADYVFGSGFLEALASVELPNDKLFFPRHTWINKTHALGDQYALRAADHANWDHLSIDPEDFMQRRESKAIGGLQIIPGDVARKYGYCKDDKQLQSSVTDGKWKDTKGDFRYRKILGTRGTPLDLPNLYRIRQTTEGVVDTLKIQP